MPQCLAVYPTWHPPSSDKSLTKSLSTEIEVYVDDMIARSQNKEEHLDHLQKLFDRLKLYKLRLNPNKCTFRVRSGKLLGFVVSDKGIQVDPAK